jgi:hypothetical protein
MLKTVAAAGFAGSLLFLMPGATGPPPVGGVRHFRVTNETGQPIVELYLAVAGSGNWQGDLLGRDYLSPGNSVLVAIDDPNESCQADLRIVLDDGSERVSRDADICLVADFSVARR